MDGDITTWVAVIAGSLVFCGLLYATLSPKRRMMRCPETGSISLVRVTPVPGAGGKSSEIRVAQCDLWPGKQGCAQGCLARYGEVASGWRENLQALRPFEPQ